MESPAFPRVNTWHMYLVRIPGGVIYASTCKCILTWGTLSLLERVLIRPYGTPDGKRSPREQFNGCGVGA